MGDLKMNRIEKIISNNIYIESSVRNTVFRKRNHELREKLSLLDSIDPIVNYTDFKKYIMKWKSDPSFGNKIHDFGIVGKESIHYGHLDALFEYAGVNKKQYNILFPEVEHGINWYERLPLNFESVQRMNYVFQGTYRKGLIHKVNPYIPTFCIGPYIFYADYIYSQDELAKIKKKIGRTLLVFPFHCYELSKAEYNVSAFVDDIMSRYAEGFDTVLVCAYWNDVNDPVYQAFESRGALIVSNGFRDDVNFIKRQKTLIYLSDATLGNDLGTHIGYSICLGKPHILIGDKAVTLSESVKQLSTEESKLYSDTLSNFKHDFSYENFLQGSVGDDSEQYIKFWGGISLVKSPEEMRAIIDVAKDILHETHGFWKNTTNAVKALLKRYENDHEEQKLRVLCESVSHEQDV